MLETIKETILQTPWWVYLILAFVLYRGIRATKTQILKFRHVFVLPLILIFFSASNLFRVQMITVDLIINLIITLLVAGILGWFTVKAADIQVDHRNHLMRVPGSWWLLIILIIIFTCAYYVGYMTSVHPDIVKMPRFMHGIFLINGFTMGLLIGRLARNIYCHQTKPTVDLKF